ncbi:MAG TPA: glycosyltransferase family 1 protein [Solirubrobacterales bacterium]|nr:glycosyltransferase family 1 protein [Solirubrobacterales bacterium]
METGVLGGVEQVVIGVADALSGLEGGNEEYLFLTTPGKDNWLRPYMKGACRTMPLGAPPAWTLRRYKLRHLLSRGLPFLRGVRIPPPAPRDVMVSEGTIEQADVDVVHFLCQMAFLTEVPSLYHPHDLLHLHLPEELPARDVELRELWYRAFCGQASLVVAMTEWGRRDLIQSYGLQPERTAVVPWGVVTHAYPEPTAADLDRTRHDLGLPGDFLLYPGQTWAHKNHGGLLEALALLKERHGETPPLVCSGHLNELYPRLAERTRKLGLEETTRFVGFVDPLQLRCLYALATGLIFPSRFEGWGMPVTEAFSAGVPVACSAVTSLPEVAAGAALLFDPDDVEQIADSAWRLWTDAELRTSLIERGRRRAAELSFERTARTFRAHYRRIAGRPLSDEDRSLIDASLSPRAGGITPS